MEKVTKVAQAARASRVAAVAKGQTNGFMDFIREQGVIGLAVGLVFGGALTILVKSFIDNVIMPPLGFVLGSAEGLKGLSVALGKTPNGKDAVLHYGLFLNDFVNFLVLAAVVYLIVHVLGLDKRLGKKKPEEPKIIENAKPGPVAPKSEKTKKI